MNPITIPPRTDEEWRALVEQWRKEAKAKVDEYRRMPYKHEPNYSQKEKRK